MNHPHSVMSFPSLTGSPTSQTLHSSHFSSVFADCPSEPSLDLNFVQKLSQHGQKAQNEFELGQSFNPHHQSDNSPSSHLELITKAIPESGASNGSHDKQALEGVPVKPAPRSRCHWSHGEVMALFDAKKAEADRFDAEMPGKKIKYSSERWDEVASFVKTRGCTKLASQCKDKWEKIWPAFRKIFDWEKQIPVGKASFWTMLGDEREQEGFPRGFDKELYDAMAARFGYIRPTDLASIVVDSSNEDSVDFGGFANDPVFNEPEVLEDGPSVVDDLVLETAGRKRKSPASSSKTQGDKDNQDRMKTPKDPQLTKKLAEKLALEERKIRLAEKRFLLEEKKLEATIEIGKGLITSMEKMTHTISCLGQKR